MNRPMLGIPGDGTDLLELDSGGLLVSWRAAVFGFSARTTMLSRSATPGTNWTSIAWRAECTVRVVLCRLSKRHDLKRDAARDLSQRPRRAYGFGARPSVRTCRKDCAPQPRVRRPV